MAQDMEEFIPLKQPTYKSSGLQCWLLLTMA